MSKKERLKKRKKLVNTIIKGIIISVVMLYFISRMSPLLIQGGRETYLVEYGKIESVVYAEGYVARDEEVFKSPGEGKAVYFVSEGEKVAKGQKLAEIHLNNTDDKTARALDSINLRIQNIREKQMEQPFFESDAKKLNKQIDAAVKEIRQYIKNEEFSSAGKKKDELLALAEKRSIISGVESFAGRNLEELEKQEKMLSEKMGSFIKVIRSEYPGIVAFGTDGLEDLINLSSIEHITGRQFQILKKAKMNKTETELKEGTPVIRIIKSHRWSILCELDEKDVSGLKEGKRIKIRQQNQNREYYANVRRLFRDPDSDNWFVILDLNEFINGFYNTRTMDIEIIKKSHEGILVPNEAIIEKGKQKGVYRIDANGFTEFVPVKIKGNNSGYSVVHNGSFETTDNEGKTKTVNTLNLYDEIVVDGEKITAGKKIY